jgi:hypothetical protein
MAGKQPEAANQNFEQPAVCPDTAILPLQACNDNQRSSEIGDANLLPPPVDTVLWFAIQGWHYAHAHVTVHGLSRTPPRYKWLPPFMRMIAADNFREQMRDLACAGFTLYSNDIEVLHSKARIFDLDGIEDAMIDGIAEFACRPEPD